ncbi:MAG TPA: type II toxin-antitoxin system VapC family toxin [Actinomycetota bacterium]|nr:type II toxin-antitoxin system VapC family toxin [Actinomycetota bacterium]
MPPGRRPLSHRIFSFEAAELILPSEITLDTSFVVNALFVGEALHEPARGFLQRLAEARSILVFNELLELEVRETAFRIPLVERFPDDWRRRRHDGRSLRRAHRLVRGIMDAWEDLLSAFTYLEVQVAEVMDRVEELMGTFGLSSYDAVHVATGEYAGARTLVTTDAGFASVPETRLTIYTNASRVGPCRRMRGHR